MLGLDRGDEISEAVDVDHRPADALFAFPRFRPGQADGIVDGGAEALGRDTAGEMSRRRREDVAPVECSAHDGSPILTRRQLEGAPLRVPERRREQAVVWPHEEVTAGHDHERAPIRSHAGIDHRQVDRPRGKRGGRRLERQCRLGHLLGLHVVGDVHELDVGREREDDALHLGDVAIAGAEICGEGDDRGHAGGPRITGRGRRRPRPGATADREPHEARTRSRPERTWLYVRIGDE